MPENIGSAYVQIIPSMDGVSKEIGKGFGEAGEKEGAKTGKRFSASLKKSLGKAGKIAAGAGALAAGAGAAIAKIGMDYNREMEGYTTNFTTMLGNEQAAVEKVNELKKFAASTPLSMGDLAKGTQTLLAFGVASEDSTDTLRMLGDIALGDADKMQSMARSFGKATASGKLTGDTVQSMIDAGWNPLISISEAAGETMEETQKRMAKGAIGIDELKAAMKAATSEGGQFAGGMEAASHTTDGLISTLQDNARALAGELSAGLSETLKNELLPTALDVVAFLTDKVPVITAKISEVIQKVMPLVKRAIAFIYEHMPQIKAVVSKAINGAATVIRFLAPIVQKVFAKIVSIVKGLIALWKGPFGDSVKSGISTAIVNIKNFFVSAQATFRRVVAALTNLKNNFKNAFEKIRSTVTSVVEKIKGIFNFTWSLPKLKVPKFSIDPDGWKVGDLLKGVIPKLTVKWNAEGGIFNSPSIVGYGVGEAGAEAIVPLGKFWGKLDALTESVRSGAGSGAGAITVQVNMDGQTIAQRTVDYINEQTIVFNMSPLLT